VQSRVRHRVHNGIDIRKLSGELAAEPPPAHKIID